MYNPILGGSIEEIQGLKCHLPPVGKVWNYIEGKLDNSPVISRSRIHKEQYWERQGLPSDYDRKRSEEVERQKIDPGYVDAELESIRRTEWHRRLFGCWFMNNGVPVYLTGPHYFFLTWWSIDIGYPNYRESDRKFFYFWECAVNDPDCLGVLWVTKRRAGKTWISTVLEYERISRIKSAWGGIQSKTYSDAQGVFDKLVSCFKKLPHFFVPTYDQSKGLTPKGELVFQNTVIKGKRAEEIKKGSELESRIDYASSEKYSYDGKKLIHYTGDEIFKTIEVDIADRHKIVRPCFELGKRIIGKAFYTSTVEDIDASNDIYLKFWLESDQSVRNKNNRTITGLYRYFTPAYEISDDIDIYGFVDQEKEKEFYLNEREALQGDPKALSAYIRKFPFIWEEAFRIDSETCLYDSMKLNDQLALIAIHPKATQRGNLVWKDGEKDTEVVWEPCHNGRWTMACDVEEKFRNNVKRSGSLFYPMNQNRYAIGIDPFDHDETVDNRRSNGACAVLKKHNSAELDDPYNRAFILCYSARPASSAIYYEDMIKTCFYTGAPMLFEDNKPGVGKYFQERGYAAFLMWLPGRNKPGISGTPQTIQEIAEKTEDYINSSCNKVWFPKLINDWLKFSKKKTTMYDDAMAAGYALIADKVLANKRPVSDDIYEAKSVFRTYKVY